MTLFGQVAIVGCSWQLSDLDKAKGHPLVGADKFLGNMVRPERFELPTFWFVARRSIQLS